MGTWKPFRLFASTTVLFGLVQAAFLTFTQPGDRLYAFIYARGPVQHATLCVACLVAVLLLVRRPSTDGNAGSSKPSGDATGNGRAWREELAAVAAVREHAAHSRHRADWPVDRGAPDRGPANL